VEGLAVLVEALQRGSEAVWEPPDRPRLGRVPADLRERLYADREAVRQVMARAAAFRAHLTDPGPAPVLVLPDRGPEAGGCISCGTATPTVRCSLCSLACWIALGLAPPSNILGAP
jgi:hypothetical protein